jgi:hypothetical protein
MHAETGGPTSVGPPLRFREDQIGSAIGRQDDVRHLLIELDLLTPEGRRHLANALLRAAWSAALEETRILLLDLLVEVDDGVLGEAA